MRAGEVLPTVGRQRLDLDGLVDGRRTVEGEQAADAELLAAVDGGSSTGGP
jgi:hypothetical protein